VFRGKEIGKDIEIIEEETNQGRFGLKDVKKYSP
jgi:hypothetical protein